MPEGDEKRESLHVTDTGPHLVNLTVRVHGTVVDVGVVTRVIEEALDNIGDYEADILDYGVQPDRGQYDQFQGVSLFPGSSN